MKDKYDVIIVGSGIGGLTSGLFIQSKNPNLRTIIFEQNDYPGGYVSGFHRKGFYFDSAAEGIFDPFRSSWYSFYKEKGLNQDLYHIEPVETYFHDNIQFQLSNSKEVFLKQIDKYYPGEREKMVAFLNTLFKMAEEIEALKLDDEKPNLVDIIKIVLTKPYLRKYGRMSFYEIAQKFSINQNLLNYLCLICSWLGMPNTKVSAPFASVMIEGIFRGGLFYPKGGMINFTKKLVDLYQNYGGKIEYQSLVKKIIVKNGKAVGVQLANNTKIYAKVVISNADLKRTVFDYVGEEYFPKEYAKKIHNIQDAISGIMLFLGVDNLDLSKYPPHFHIGSSSEGLLEHVIQGEFSLDCIAVRIHSNIDPNLNPPGKNSISVLTFAPYDWKEKWQTTNGKNRSKEYKDLKNDITEQIIKKIETVIPNLNKHIVLKELATPITFERYNLVTKGSWYGPARNQKLPSYKSPLKNLFFTGSNTMGAGVPTAITSGLRTGKNVLKQLNRMKLDYSLKKVFLEEP